MEHINTKIAHGALKGSVFRVLKLDTVQKKKKKKMVVVGGRLL